MAKAIVPMEALRYDQRTAFALDAAQIFYQYGHLDDDCFTYTARICVPDDDERSEMRQALEERLGDEEARRLTEFLDANDWNASFFVDWYEE